jgi:hypothetical protein
MATSSASIGLDGIGLERKDWRYSDAFLSMVNQTGLLVGLLDWNKSVQVQNKGLLGVISPAQKIKE